MRSALILSAALVGCSSPSAKGSLVDGMTGAPIAEQRLIANANGTVGLTCTTFEATTDASGNFSFDQLCSGASYTIVPADENWWLAEDDQIPDGGAAGLALKAWRAPKGSGMYRLSKGELASIKTSADIKTEPIWNHATETAQYPATLPKSPVGIGPDDHLVLVGAGAVEKTQFLPLIESPARKFGSDKTSVITMDPWSYIGIAFTSDTEFERKSATPDAGKIVTKAKGDRTVSWIKGDAVPAGRYAVHKEKDGRTTVLDFGATAN